VRGWLACWLAGRGNPLRCGSGCSVAFLRGAAVCVAFCPAHPVPASLSPISLSLNLSCTCLVTYNAAPVLLLADVWAFGTVMWELMTWQTPFEGVNPYQVSLFHCLTFYYV
jgi:hypothetical protein